MPSQRSEGLKTSNSLVNQFSPLDSKSLVFPDITTVKKTRHFSDECGVNVVGAYDYVMKVILLGDHGVGKTSYMRALKVHPDVGKVPCKCRVAQASDHLELETCTAWGKTVLVRLCDTGGQERYRSLTSSYYRGAHGVIIMFDLNRQQSLDNTEHWFNDVNSFTDTSSCVRILLGSNCASMGREVTSQYARRFAENRDVPYMELEASQFFNVVESIQLVVDRVCREVTIAPPNSYVIHPRMRVEEEKRKNAKDQFSCIC